jgi:hypothetical protein
MAAGALRKGLPKSKGARWRVEREKLEKRAKGIWAASPQFEKMRKIDRDLPSRRYREMKAELPCKKASILFQLRSGHIPLGVHLHRISRAGQTNA